MNLEHCYELLADIAVEQDLGTVEPLSEEETAAVLDLARVVAHAVERKAAPLVSFSMGRALAQVDADARASTIRDVIARIEAASGELASEA